MHDKYIYSRTPCSKLLNGRIATRAMRLFLDTQPRPIRARAAADNAASVAVLGKLGFVEVARDRGYANARGREIDEIVLELR